MNPLVANIAVNAPTNVALTPMSVNRLVPTGWSYSNLGNMSAADPVGNVYASYNAFNGYGVNFPNSGGVLKLSPQGQVLWCKTYTGVTPTTAGPIDFCQCVAYNPTDGYIYAVFSYQPSGGTNTSQLLIVKFDSNGNIIWQNTYGSTGIIWRYPFIYVAPDGSMYVQMFNNTSGINQVIKITTTGAITWQQQLTGVSNGFYMTFDSSSNPIISFASQSTANGTKIGSIDMIVMKLTSAGAITFQKRINISGANNIARLQPVVDPSGNIIIGGIIQDGTGTNATYGVLAKVDSTFSTISWQRQIGAVGTKASGTPDVYMYDPLVASDGSISFTGEIDNNPTFTAAKYAVAKYDTSGTLQYQREWSSSGYPLTAPYDSFISNNIIYGNCQVGALDYTTAQGTLFKQNVNTTTGTYGIYSYATSSYPTSIPSLTIATPSPAFTFPTSTTFSPTASALTFNNLTVTSTNTILSASG